MAASVSRPMPATSAFEDYSVYSHLSDKELIQLATERSLTDAHGPSQPAHRFVCSPLTQTQTEPSKDNTFCEIHREDTARRQAAVCVQDNTSFANGSNIATVSR